MALEEKRIFHIEDDISSILNTQLAVEDIADSDLGFKMWGGKDGDGNVTKFLAKNKPARVTTLDITSGDLNMHSQNITDVSLVDGVDVSDHAARHIRGGADEIDGDLLDIDYAPSYYTPAVAPTSSHVDHLASHLKGIDDALDAISSGGVSGLTPGAIQFGSATGDLDEDPNSLWWDDTNDFLGINRGGAAPACGLHMGASSPSHVFSDDDVFCFDFETVGTAHIGVWLYGYSYDDNGVPWFDATKKLNTDGANFYYTGATFGVTATDTDTNCQVDIEAAPVYSAAGGDAVINLTATAQGANNGEINLVSNGDILLDASEVVRLESGNNKASIVLYPTADGDIRFTGNYIITNWTTPYILLGDGSAQWATFESEFGQVSIINALHQLYGASGGVSEPAGQIVYGTGSGVDSESTFKWDSVNDFLNINRTSGAAACGIHLGDGAPVLCNSDDDLYVHGYIECQAGFMVQDAVPVYFGEGFDASMRYSTAQTFDALMISTPSSSRTIIICEQADVATDFGYPMQDNPALIFHASDATDPDKYGLIKHNGTNFNISTGKGAIYIPSAGDGSVCLYLSQTDTSNRPGVINIYNTGCALYGQQWDGPRDILINGGTSPDNIHSIANEDGELWVFRKNTGASANCGVSALGLTHLKSELYAKNNDGSHYANIQVYAYGSYSRILFTCDDSIGFSGASEIDLNAISVRDCLNFSFGGTPTLYSYSSSLSVQWATGKPLQKCTATGNITSVSFADPNGVAVGCHLIIEANNPGGTITIDGWPANVYWPNGDPGAVEIGHSEVGIFSFVYDANTDKYYGSHIGGV
jgi:hypothetical protein